MLQDPYKQQENNMTEKKKNSRQYARGKATFLCGTKSNVHLLIKATNVTTVYP